MKNLFFITLFLFSSSAMALDFLGGTVKSGEREMGVTCASFNNDGVCEELDVHIRYDKEEEFYQAATLETIDASTVGQRAGQRAGRDLNRTYQTTAYAGVGLGFIVFWGSKKPVLGVPAMVVGGIVDVVKAPVVGVLYLGHKLSDAFARKRMKKLVKFMLNPKKKGKSKRTRKRYFKALASSIRY